MAIAGASEKIAGLFFDKGGAVFNVKHPDFGAVGNGVADDRAAIVAADTAALSGPGGITVPAGSYRIASNLTIASPLTFAKGASLAPDAGVTVTLNGYTSSIRQQIFSGAGTVLFGPGQDFVYPEWFGAKGDSNGTGGGTNDSPAMALACASLTWGATADAPVGILSLGRAKYRLSSPLTPNSANRLVHVIGGGSGRNGGGDVSVLVLDAGVNGFNVTPVTAYSIATQTKISGVSIIAAGKTTSAVGIYATSAIRLQDFYIQGFAGDGLSLRATYVTRGVYTGEATSCSGFIVSDGAIVSCGGNGFVAYGADANCGSVTNVYCSANGLANFRDDTLYGVKFDTCWSDKTTTGGVGFTNSVITDTNKERATHCINCYDGDYQVISPNSDLRHPARIDGGTLAYQIKAATSTAHITPPETGSWTPALSFGTSGSVAYNAASTGGRWMHYGDEVVLEGTILLGALSSPTGNVYITGLTGLLNDTGRATNANFTPSAGQTRYHTFPIMGSGYAAGITGGLSGRILPNGVLATAFEINKNTAGGSVAMVGADLVANTTELYFRIAYRVI